MRSKQSLEIQPGAILCLAINFSVREFIVNFFTLTTARLSANEKLVEKNCIQTQNVNICKTKK